MLTNSILVVDRDREVGNSISEFLRDDFDIHIVNNGRDVLDTIRKHEIKLLLTDIDLPDVYFYQLLNRIKEEFPALPVILMYVYCDCTQEMEDTLRQLADAIFLKPFDLQELKKRIEYLLHSRSTNGFPQVRKNQSPGF
ncbi:MAG: response regulator [Calditrichia bacterium]